MLLEITVLTVEEVVMFTCWKEACDECVCVSSRGARHGKTLGIEEGKMFLT